MQEGTRQSQTKMGDLDITRFTADTLLPRETAALKETERRNRDRGASAYLRALQLTRGPFQLRAESRVILRYLSLRTRNCAMDVGAGVGRLALLVAPKVRKLLCLDLSRTSLDVLK